MTYQSQAATEPVTHDVHPYALVFAKNSFYLVAFAPHHAEVRHYKLDRISQVDVQPLKFPKPLDFNLDQHFAGSWSIYRGRAEKPFVVRVRFTAEVSRYIQEKRWHASQKLLPQRDGTVIAEFQLTATEEIKAWVLSFGTKAEVLEPESLREEIINGLQETLDCYSDSKSLTSGRASTSISSKGRRRAK
ncbi:MAG: WYL domain-containing protein [Planctomycetia bacterium]|nr:WYL domain-containing protein [Planctomycetia bacterium]